MSSEYHTLKMKVRASVPFNDAWLRARQPEIFRAIPKGTARTSPRGDSRRVITLITRRGATDCLENLAGGSSSLVITPRSSRRRERNPPRGGGLERGAP